MKGSDRRALIGGVGIVFGALTALRVVPLLAERVGFARTRARDRVASLEQARQVVREAPVARESLRTLVGELLGMAPALVEGRTHADAASTMSGWISMTANGCRVRVTQVESSVDPETGPVRPVTMHAQLEGDVSGLGCVLRAVEGGNPLLTVRTLALTALDAAPRSGAPETIRGDVVLSGWYLAPVSP